MGQAEKTLLLIIDAQNDFCDKNGSLAVPGAQEDMARLAAFIRDKRSVISDILLSQDTHQPINISFPLFWLNQNNQHPAPFTSISANEMRRGIWKCSQTKNQELALNYLTNLEAQGDFTHIIWPMHCVEGSVGAAFYQPLMDAVCYWCAKGASYTVLQKGRNSYTEQFGIVAANIPDPNDLSTQTNIQLITQLRQYSQIYIAGQAKSHCVAYTIKQLMPYPDLIAKLIVLTDCMSAVKGFEQTADPIFEQAYMMGAQKISSSQL